MFPKKIKLKKYKDKRGLLLELLPKYFRKKFIYSILTHSKKNEALFIPKGYAHGYKCKGQKNILIYLLTKSYNTKNNKGIFWNDSSLNIKWRIRNPIVSKRDLNLPKLR